MIKDKTKQKCFNFKDQNKKGKTGENLFMKYYHKELPRHSVIFDYDLTIRKDERVELKTDFTESKNFFIERYGNTEKLKEGGPWQIKDKADYFVYFFIKSKIFYWFNPVQLCNFLDKNIDKFQQRKVFNPGYFSTGLLVPIIDIEHLLVRKDSF